MLRCVSVRVYPLRHGAVDIRNVCRSRGKAMRNGFFAYVTSLRMSNE